MLLRDAWHPSLFSYDDAEGQIRSSGRLLDQLLDTDGPLPLPGLVVKNSGRLLDKLYRPPKAEVLTAHLRTCLRAETQQLITQWPLIRHAVVADLNRVLAKPWFSTSERVATVQFRAKTRRYLAQHQTDADPRRLNCLLLTDAYRGCLKPARYFWPDYLLFCIERHCHQYKLPVEIPSTVADPQGARGVRYGHDTPAGDTISMHPETAVAIGEFSTKFGDVLAMLPLEDRRLILLYYFYHWRLARYARAFGIAENNAKQRLHRARLRLIKALRREPYFQELLEEPAAFMEWIGQYWKPFSLYMVERFASDLADVPDVSVDEMSEDERDEEGGASSRDIETI